MRTTPLLAPEPIEPAAVHDVPAPPTSPAPARPSRRGRPLVIAAGLVLLAELAVRAVDLPEPLVWSSAEAQVKAAELAALGVDGVDIVVVGSSVADVAVRPELLVERTGVDLAYNASLLGSDLASIELWVREVVVPSARPDVVVLALSCRELNGEEPAQAAYHRDFVDAPAMRDLLGTETVLDRVDDVAGDVSALVRYRSVLRVPRDIWDTDRRIGVNLDLVEGGFNRAYTDRGYPAAADLHDVLHPGDIVRFRVGDEQTAALDRTLAVLADADVRAVVVHMPSTADWTATYLPPGAMATCRAAMAERAEAGGATFVDGGVLDHSLFADPIHVNGDGADVVTGIVADAVAEATR